jgi:hypothetical protein
LLVHFKFFKDYNFGNEVKSDLASYTPCFNCYRAESLHSRHSSSKNVTNSFASIDWILLAKSDLFQIIGYSFLFNSFASLEFRDFESWLK